jgi:hypothetical protein
LLWRIVKTKDGIMLDSVFNVTPCKFWFGY